MIPQIANVQTPAPAATANASAQEPKAPQAPSSTPVARTELAQAVPAVARPPEAGAPSKETRRNLNPPDPNAPAGPPPSFEASILDRAREEATTPALDVEVDLTQPEEIDPFDQPPELNADGSDPATAGARAPVDGGASPDDPAGGDGEQVADPRRDPYFAPPTPSARAETEVATLRQMEAPAAQPEIDRTI